MVFFKLQPGFKANFPSFVSFLQAWIAEMASYVKILDEKHLVTIGLEGFYGPKRPEKLMANPGDWAASFGSDFIQDSAIKHIDFASVHAYPDSWLVQIQYCSFMSDRDYIPLTRICDSFCSLLGFLMLVWRIRQNILPSGWILM